MTIRARVMQALKNIGIPVYWVKWVGDTPPPRPYIIFQGVSRPAHYADNRYTARIHYIYMDLYSDQNPHQHTEAIRSAMESAGFSEVEQRDVAQDTLARTEMTDFHIAWTWVYREVIP